MARTSRRSEIITFALLIGAAGLGTWVWLDRGKPTTKEYAARAGMLLRVFRQDDLTRISVDRRGQKHELVREGEVWKLVAPKIYRTDFIAVQGLINALGGARAEREVGVVSQSERAQMGLDAPRATIELVMKGVTIKIALGSSSTGASVGETGVGAAYLEISPYAEFKGGVFVVTPDVAAAIDRGPEAYRDPSLVGPHVSTTFARLELKGVVTLERAPHGTWRIPSGAVSAPVRADIDAVDGIFKVFSQLKADPFVDDTTPLDITKGALVDVKLEPPGLLSIAFGGACPKDEKLVLVQQRAPETITGCVAKVTTDRLLRDAASYVDGHAWGLLYGTDTAKISEIEYVELTSAGAKVLEAERKSDGLLMRVPTTELIDKDGSDRYLIRLAAVTGTVVAPPNGTWATADLAALGLEPAQGTAKIRRKVDPMSLGPLAKGGSELWDQTIYIGKPIDPKAGETGPRVVHLRRVDDGAVLRVPFDVAAPLFAASVYELRNPNLLQLTPDSIKKVTVRTTLPSVVPYTLDRLGTVFVLTAPPKLGADAASAGDVMRHLASLTCNFGWRAKDEPSFGFAAPTAVIEIARDTKAIDGGAPAGDQVIELGASTAEGGVYARVKGTDPVCVIGEAKRDALLRVPFDRSLIAFRADESPRIVITRGTAARAMLWNDPSKSWRDAAGAGGAADLVARKLADMAVALRAEGIVHLGAAKEDEGFATPTVVIEGFADATTKTPKRKLVIGALGKLDKVPVYFVRLDGIDATLAILRDDVDKLLQAM